MGLSSSFSLFHHSQRTVVRWDTWPLRAGGRCGSWQMIGSRGSVRHFASINASQYRISPHMDIETANYWSSLVSTSSSHVRSSRRSGTPFRRGGVHSDRRMDSDPLSALIPCRVLPSCDEPGNTRHTGSSTPPAAAAVTEKERAPAGRLFQQRPPPSSSCSSSSLSSSSWASSTASTPPRVASQCESFLLLASCSAGMRLEMGLEAFTAGAIIPPSLSSPHHHRHSQARTAEVEAEVIVRHFAEFLYFTFPCLKKSEEEKKKKEERGSHGGGGPNLDLGDTDMLWCRFLEAMPLFPSLPAVSCGRRMHGAGGGGLVMGAASPWIALLDELVLRIVGTAEEVDRVPPAVVHGLVRHLLASFGPEQSFSHDEVRLRECRNMLSDIIAKWLDRTSHAYVAAIVLALQVKVETVCSGGGSQPPPANQHHHHQHDDDAAAHKKRCVAAQWHPLVGGALALRCYQRVLVAVKAAKQHPALGALLYNPLPNSDHSRPQWPRDDELRALHTCVLCSLPSDASCSDDMKTALAILCMSCLRFATLTDLTTQFAYLKGILPRATYSLVCSKFLASTGSSIFSTGSSLHASEASLIRDALEELTPSPGGQERRVKEVEEGLVHGSAVLRALGDAAHVRQLYKNLPELRETAHSVAACITLGDVSEALAALSKLGHSQSSGWVYIPAIVVETMSSASRLVGRRGDANHVLQLYRALLSFQNKGMLLSNYMELTLGGVADRMLDIASQHQQQKVHQRMPEEVNSCSSPAGPASAGVPPREVVNVVVPLVETTLMLLGDDVNADVIFTLMESSIRAGSYAVPLTVGLMNAMRRAAHQHISLSLFFSPADDPCYHRSPFLVYFALCTARDFRLREVFDHLATIWGVEGSAIWHRAAHLSPSYKLWQCGSCGRRNSDRFNYCACSALRYGIVVCGSCGYAQDERWAVCLSCGASPWATEKGRMTTPMEESCEERVGVTAENGGASPTPAPHMIIRKSWCCSACHATNPSRHTLLCFRCSKLTGPLGQLQKQKDAHQCQRSTAESFCQCLYGAGGTYTSSIGYCHSCQVLKQSFSRTSSYVWRCSSCHHLRSSLERTCPRCPQVECVPYLFSHAVSDTRYCYQCHAAHEGQPFSEVCAQCGANDPAFSLTDGVLRTTMTESSSHDNRSRTIPPGNNNNNNNNNRTVTDPKACPHCDKEKAPYALSLLCRYCLGFIPPQVEEGSATMASSFTDGNDNASTNSNRDSPQTGTTTTTHLRVAGERVHEEDENIKRKVLRHTVSAVRDGLLAMCTTDHLLLPSNGIVDPVGVDALLGGLIQALEVIISTGRGEKPAESAPSAGRPSLDMIVSNLKETVEMLQKQFSSSVLARRASALIMSTITHERRPGDGSGGFDPCTEERISRDGVGEQLVAEIGNHTEIGIGANPPCSPRRAIANERLPAFSGSGNYDFGCSYCFGTHPVELCPFNRMAWHCVCCGQENRNDDVHHVMSRYCCKSCLSLRPVVRDLHPSTCWTCGQCQRSNMEFEKYCIYCGRDSGCFPESTPFAAPLEGESCNDLLLPPLAIPEPSHLISATPFAPAQCPLCQRVYLESSCPDCSALLHSRGRRDDLNVKHDVEPIDQRTRLPNGNSCIPTLSRTPSSSAHAATVKQNTTCCLSSWSTTPSSTVFLPSSLRQSQ